MNKPSILIIEDDKAVKNLIATTLEMHDYHYIWADKGEQGILSAASQRPDIILLDLGLPDMDGVDVILKIRSWTNTPIIVISARSEDSDKIAALDAGADDYLTKPFFRGRAFGQTPLHPETVKLYAVPGGSTDLPVCQRRADH